MRKKVICAFVLAMLLSAAACGSRGKGNSDPGSDKDSVSGATRTGRIEEGIKEMEKFGEIAVRYPDGDRKIMEISHQQVCLH